MQEAISPVWVTELPLKIPTTMCIRNSDNVCGPCCRGVHASYSSSSSSSSSFVLPPSLVVVALDAMMTLGACLQRALEERQTRPSCGVPFPP